MPRFRSQSAEPSTNWAVPIQRVGGIEISVSFGILIAVVAVTLTALTASTSPGNADIPRTAGLGVLFWISGWLVQSVTLVSTSRLLGTPVTELCLGVLGVELGPRRWPARRALLVAFATITSLIVLGSFYRLIEGGFQIPRLGQTDASTWTPPSFGLTKHDSLWRVGAWLCWAQAVLQLYPLPRTLGRQIVGAATVICSMKMELPVQVSIFQRCLGTIAILTMVITIASIFGTFSLFGIPWIVFFLMSLLLWISARRVDLGLILVGFRSQKAEADVSPNTWTGDDDNTNASHHSVGSGSVNLFSRIRGVLCDWRARRQLLAAQRREKDEAVDARRLDEILTRLHRDGSESLSAEDRQILERVSESLRRQRTQSSVSSRPSD